MSLRISGGELKGRRLHTPRGLVTRPTGARLKKSLFDVLSARIPEAVVLDLYAGAGALGIEALSRGASHATFVDRDRHAAAAIRRNVEDFGLEDRTRLVRRDVLHACRALEGPFDVVFADPPYRSDELERLLEALGEIGIVTVVVVEHHHKKELAEGYGELQRFRVLKAGESSFSLYERVG